MPQQSHLRIHPKSYQPPTHVKRADLGWDSKHPLVLRACLTLRTATPARDRCALRRANFQLRVHSLFRIFVWSTLLTGAVAFSPRSPLPLWAYKNRKQSHFRLLERAVNAEDLRAAQLMQRR